MKDIEQIRGYYQSRLCAFGVAGSGNGDHAIVGWESGEAQIKRFEVLFDHVPLEGKSLLDVGCGVGSLYSFLREKKINFEYTGVDILPEMTAEAVKRNPSAQFITGDIFSQKIFPGATFDVVFSSGLFNLNTGRSKGFLRTGFTVMAALARRTVVFNLLHERSSNRENDYLYYHPDEVKIILGRWPELKSAIRIIEEYLPNDFTVICQVGNS